MPVIVQIMTKRGCNGGLYESFLKLGDKGVVKTAQEACIRDSHAVTLINKCLTNYQTIYDATRKSNT